jgi:hypothetical protein
MSFFWVGFLQPPQNIVADLLHVTIAGRTVNDSDLLPILDSSPFWPAMS